MCPLFPLSAGPSIPLLIPLGCHIEETHLFYDQKASGILGLEFWGTKGVPTFPTAVLDELMDLYHKPEMTLSQCGDASRLASSEVLSIEPEFTYSFALCLSPNGGIMSFGAPNSDFHAQGHVLRRLDSIESNKYRSPLIVSSSKSQSYLLGLMEVKITKNATLTPALNSEEFFQMSVQDTQWSRIDLKPSATLKDDSGAVVAEIVPTLFDSGTTLTYMPARLFGEILFAIEHRVAVNAGMRDKDQSANHRRLERVPAERIFEASDTPVVVSDLLNDRPPAGAIEFVPVTSTIVSKGPKRLVRLSAMAHSSNFRRMQTLVLNALVEKLDAAPAGSSPRRLQDSPPSWYAVFEPSTQMATEQDVLLGFLDLPESMEGAIPRALVSKLDGYSNGECWWLQDKTEDLPLFPMLSYTFYNSEATLWHPLSYMYSGTNEHFWCLAMMTDTPAHGSSSDAADREIIFGSNSFVHHDVIFAVDDTNDKNHIPSQGNTGTESELPEYYIHKRASIMIVPATCPVEEIRGRPNMVR